MRPIVLLAVAASALLAVVAGFLVMGSGDSEAERAMVRGEAEAPGEAEAGPRDDAFLPVDGPRARPRRGNRNLAAKVDSLEREVALLRREVNALRSGSDLPPLSPAPADPEDEDFRAGVQAVLEQERAQERERRDEQRRERFEAFTEETLDELQTRAGVSDEHRQTIAALWTSEVERIVPLFEEAREGNRSFREVREEVESIREETDTQAKALLDAEQIEAYDELRPRGPGRRGRERD